MKDWLSQNGFWSGIILKPWRQIHALVKANAWKLNSSHVTHLAMVHSPYRLFICSSSWQYLEASAVLQAGDLSQGFSNCKSIQPSGLMSCSKKTCENEGLLLEDISFWYWGLHTCKKMHRDLQNKLHDYLYSKAWLNKVICTKVGERPEGWHPLAILPLWYLQFLTSSKRPFLSWGILPISPVIPRSSNVESLLDARSRFPLQ